MKQHPQKKVCLYKHERFTLITAFSLQ